jgi:hypothetical protein
MTVWIVKDFENEIVDIFKTKEGAYSYLSAELARWNDEFPTDFDDFTYNYCKEALFHDYIDQKNVLRAGLPNDECGFYLEAYDFEIKG